MRKVQLKHFLIKLGIFNFLLCNICCVSYAIQELYCIMYINTFLISMNNYNNVKTLKEIIIKII